MVVGVMVRRRLLHHLLHHLRGGLHLAPPGPRRGMGDVTTTLPPGDATDGVVVTLPRCRAAGGYLKPNS